MSLSHSWKCETLCGSLLLGWTAATGLAQGRPGPAPGGPRPEPQLPVAALPGLTPAERAEFGAGRSEFVLRQGRDQGLGPVFNARSCVECHRSGGVGGAGTSLLEHRVARIGAEIGGAYSDLAELGGPVIQRRSLREVDPTCPVLPERIPSEARFVSFRYTTPLFGAGLMEAIPESQILSREDPSDNNRDGISGRAHRVFNPESSTVEIGRFGWKAQTPSLHLFAGDAYLNELGVTSPSFPEENRPQGGPIPEGVDTAGDPEDSGVETDQLTAFMRLLAPPPAVRADRDTVEGERLFVASGCASCHTPRMTTGAHSITALSAKDVGLFSDLLLHDMGPRLADGIRQGDATGSEFRTAPLWGLMRRPFWLHDGRARSVEGAILAHGGEAEGSRSSYSRLDLNRRRRLLAYLSKL